jgi:hypothetical protein
MLENKKTCRLCQSEFGLYHGKPGKIDECPDCASDIPVYIAEQGEGDDGTVETMTKKPPVRWVPILLELAEESEE